MAMNSLLFMITSGRLHAKKAAFLAFFCKYIFLQRQNMTIALSVAFFLRMFVIDEIELKKPIWRNFAELSPFFLAETHKNNKK